MSVVAKSQSIINIARTIELHREAAPNMVSIGLSFAKIKCAWVGYEAEYIVVEETILLRSKVTQPNSKGSARYQSQGK